MSPAAASVSRGRRPALHRGVELHCTARFEREAFAEGYAVVAGIDEVGRGALCGPVMAGAVVLGDAFDVSGLDDSKRLSPRQRAVLSERIRREARAWAVGSADHAEIDRINILRATHLAMRRAVDGLGTLPDLLLVDGLPVVGVPLAQRAIVKGDALSVSIAAASIVAKVARDEAMQEWDRLYPGYGLAHNMGYGSADHRTALRSLGPSQIHRRSFQGTQPWLF